MNSLAPREGYVGLYAAEHPPSPKLRRGRQMSNDEKNDEYFPAYASRILGSTPKAFGVVAGSPAGNIFGTCITEKTLFPGLGKLPRPRSRGAGSLCSPDNPLRDACITFHLRRGTREGSLASSRL